MSTSLSGLEEPNPIVHTTKDLVARLATNRCSLLHKAYLKELTSVTDEQATTLSFAMEGSYEELTSMEAHLIEKYLNKPVRGRNPEYLSEVTKGPVGGLRIWNCDGHIIYAPMGFKIVCDPVFQTKTDKTPTQNVLERRPYRDPDTITLIACPDIDEIEQIASEASRETDLRAKLAEKEQQLADLEEATCKAMEAMQKKVDILTKALEQKNLELDLKTLERVDFTKFSRAARDNYEMFLAQQIEILQRLLPQPQTTVQPVNVDLRDVLYNKAVPPPLSAAERDAYGMHLAQQMDFLQGIRPQPQTTVQPVNVDLRHVLYNEAVPPPATSAPVQAPAKAPMKAPTKNPAKKRASKALTKASAPTPANPACSKPQSEMAGSAYAALKNEINAMLKNTTISMDDLRSASKELNKEHELGKDLVTYSNPAFVAMKNDIAEMVVQAEILRKMEEMRGAMKKMDPSTSQLRAAANFATAMSSMGNLKQRFPNKSSASSKND